MTSIRTSIRKLSLMCCGLIFSNLILTSCAANTPRHEVIGLSLDPALKSLQQEELRQADQQLEVGQFEKAKDLYQAFKSKNPNSPYFQRAQLGEAKALENLGNWSEAASLFRDMVEATRTTQPEIAAEALYQSSFCYEALGDEARVFAVLNDAQRMRESLTPEVALAEIPARLGATYNRTGRFQEAQKTLAEAEAGIQKLKVLKGDRLSPNYLSRVYLQMGKLSTNQLAIENFQSSLETLKSIQAFSLRSIELGDPTYSQLALDGIKNNYRDLYSLIQQVPYRRSMDAGAARREQMEQKSLMASGLLSAIEILRQDRKAEVDPANTTTPQLFSYLTELETKLVTFLNERGEYNELTPEALKLKSLKKNITIKSEPLFPSERK